MDIYESGRHFSKNCLEGHTDNGKIFHNRLSILLSLSQTDIYDVAVDVPPSKYCVNAIKEEKKVKRFFNGVPEEMFMVAAQYSLDRCRWASVGLIKGYLAKKGIAASRRGVAARLKALRERGVEIP